jgi:hypothetical protein
VQRIYLSIRYYFRLWRDQTKDDRDERQLISYAHDHYHRRLKRQVLFAWHEHMIQQVSIDNDNEMKCEQYRRQQDSSCRRTIYDRWKQLTNDRRRYCCLYQRAKHVHEMNMLKRYFHQWKEQHDSDRREQVRSLMD